MFKKLIKSHISCVKKYLYKLEWAYEETYSETSKELNSKIEQIRERNKQKFIKEAGEFCKWEIGNMFGLPISKKRQNFFGEQMFKIAKEKGDLDEFYNFKQDEER
jgi:hypothetical protein